MDARYRVWSSVVKEQQFYGRGAKCTVCACLLKAETKRGYCMCVGIRGIRFAQQESGAVLSKGSMYVSGQLLYNVYIN